MSTTRCDVQGHAMRPTIDTPKQRWECLHCSHEEWRLPKPEPQAAPSGASNIPEGRNYPRPGEPQAVPVPAEVLERARLAAEAIVKTWTKEGPVQLNQLWLEKEIAGYILASDAARVAAERERDALRHHYDAANVAAGRSPASSRPLSCYIEDLRSRAEAAEQRLQQVEAALAIDAKSSSGQMEDER